MTLNSDTILDGPAVSEASARDWSGETRSIVVTTAGEAVQPGAYDLVTTLVKVLPGPQRHDLAPADQRTLLVHVVRPEPSAL